MKKILWGLFIGCSVFATDYSSMSLEEMLSQKGSVPELEREAFRSEMQKKMQDLTPQERQNLKQQKKIMNKGSSYCSGGGNGNMYKGSKGNRY